MFLYKKKKFFLLKKKYSLSINLGSPVRIFGNSGSYLFRIQPSQFSKFYSSKSYTIDVPITILDCPSNYQIVSNLGCEEIKCEGL